MATTSAGPGRGLPRRVPDGKRPDFGLYLLAKPLAPRCWEQRWICWPNLRLPADQGNARNALREVWRRAAEERVVVACSGGLGRTGTPVGCLAGLDAVPADQAVAFVREDYDVRAVATLWQRRCVERFSIA